MSKSVNRPHLELKMIILRKIRLAVVCIVSSVALISTAFADDVITFAEADTITGESLVNLIAFERAKERGVKAEAISLQSDDLVFQAVLNGQVEVGVGSAYAAIQTLGADSPVRNFYQLKKLGFLCVVNKNKIKLCSVGDLNSLPNSVKDELMFVIEKTKKNKTEIKKSEPRLKKSSPPSVDVKLNFLDWIQFTQEKQNQTTLSKEADKAGPLSDKIHIIDRFLKANPKIPPGGKNESNNYSLEEDLYSNELMTETLAKVLVKQKKYKKAIGAYKILSLKYPEKNVFFAGKIQEIRKLQQE